MRRNARKKRSTDEGIRDGGNADDRQCGPVAETACAHRRFCVAAAGQRGEHCQGTVVGSEGATTQVHCRNVPFALGMRDTLPRAEIWRFCRVVHGLQVARFPARFLQEGREERAPADGIVFQSGAA